MTEHGAGGGAAGRGHPGVRGARHPAGGRRAADPRRSTGPALRGRDRQRELAYSTVVTTMSRLHAKGLLSRRRAGRGFCYAPVDEASLAAGRMSHALGSGSDRDAVLSRFVSGLSGRDAELLRRLLGGTPGGT